jgi:hypothetical protein
MPLLPRKKKMESQGNPDLAIALQMSKKPKRKKMAEGGPVSASSEKRPMPDQLDNDAKQANMASQKSLPDSQWTSPQEMSRAQKGGVYRVKHPKMVPTTGFNVKLRDQEDDLMETADVNNGPQKQPPEMYNEEDAAKEGPDVPALHMKRMAHGGQIDDSMEEDYTDKPDKGFGAIIFKAGGGEIQPEPETSDEHHASLAAAVMAKRKKMAEGGAVGPGSDMADVEHENNVEHPNGYYTRNEDAALRENYDEDMLDVSQPMDSNEHSVDIDSDEHDLDMISAIRAKRKRMMK